MNRYFPSVTAGLSGIALLSGFYWIVLFLASKDAAHPYQQFMLFWPWMTALILGFGVQIGLFWYIKSSLHMADSPKGAAATAAGTSAATMVLCCSHHAVDLLPFLGLTAAATFLTKYQLWFLIIGLISNLAGIAIMLRTIYTKKCVRLLSFTGAGEK